MLVRSGTGDPKHITITCTASSTMKGLHCMACSTTRKALQFIIDPRRKPLSNAPLIVPTALPIHLQNEQVCALVEYGCCLVLGL